MLEPAPFSSCEEGEGLKPLLSVLHLWRVIPNKDSLHKIIRPSIRQAPITMRATRMSRRKVILGVWAVADGEAITVSVYDPKAVQNLEITLVCGWWAELGISGLKSMAVSGLCGLAAYLVQGISLQIPQADRKGRVDMSKASLQFNPGPPPPLFEFGSSQFDPSVSAGKDTVAGAKRAPGRVVWRGIRTFRQRAVLLACARNGPSMMIVRGWDSSMAWRMTNVVTFHEEDWKTWKDIAEPARAPTAPFFAAEGDEEPETYANLSQNPQEPEEQAQGDCNVTRKLFHNATAATDLAVTTSAPAGGSDTSDSDCGDRQGVFPCASGAAVADRIAPEKGSTPHRRRSASPAAAATKSADQANTDRLCQAIADRVEVRSEGRGGKLALKTPRRRGEGGNAGSFGSGAGHRQLVGGDGGTEIWDGEDKEADEDEEDGGSGGDTGGGLFGGSAGRRGSVGGMLGGGEELGLTGDDSRNQEDATGIRREFLSFKHMEERVQNLDRREDSEEGFCGPRHPPEDADGGIDEWLEEFPGARTIKAIARRGGVAGKFRTMEEIVEQLAIKKKEEEALAAATRQEAVRKWKNLGKVLCRLLRMSDYWYGFASDVALSSEERAVRRVSVLHQIVEMRGVGRTTMKSLVKAIAERYPRSVWSRFRQLMRQPKAQRMRRDMAVCAILLGEVDNQFFKYTTAGWPFSRLVDLVSDSRLVKKPTLSVLYEEGETAPRRIGSELAEAASRRSPRQEQEQGREHRLQQKNEGWTVGAYVIMRGSVDLYVLERGPAAMLPTAASQEDLATKACRGQPMYHPRPPAEWEAADGAAEASGGGLNTWTDAGIPGRRRQRAITEHFEAALSGSGSGPRRAHTRNLAPRWKACRLGVGALFGDRAVLSSNEAARRSSLGTQAPRPRSTPASMPGHLAGPALETAITAEETEMLEIGTVSYRRHLAAGVRERLDHAVTLLRASGSMDGVPTPALGRICRYATERTAGPNLVDAAHPPLLNPPAGGAAQTETPPAPLESMVDGSKGQGSNAGVDRNGNGSSSRGSRGSNVMCRQATFRGTVFFVAEGEGEVVLGSHGREGCGGGREGGGGGGGGSSTESLLAATAFGDRRALQKRRNIRRRRDKKVRDSGSGSPGGTCCGFSLKGGCGDDSGSAGRGGMSVGSGRAETIEGEILSRQLGDGSTPVDFDVIAGATATKAQGAAEAATAVESRQGEPVHSAGAAALTEARQVGLTQSSPQTKRRTPGRSAPTPAPLSPQGAVSVSLLKSEQEGWQSGDSEGEWWPRPEISAGFLKRGDFFGVEPVSPASAATKKTGKEMQSQATVLFPPNAGHDYALATTTATAGATSHRHGIGDNHDTSAPASSLASKIAATTARAAAIAAAAHTLNDRCDVEETVTSRRARLTTNAEPLAITAESLDLPAPEFPGLHMASLVAGPGGLRCVTVGLAVLQKICPPVHRRLARTASERYSGWLAEARRRNEDEWQESLENESVRSLSRSFYDSFSKGCCSGSVAGKGISDMGSSVGWTSSACGRDGGGNTSIDPGFFEDDARSNGDETATVQAAELPIVPPSNRQHMPTDLSQSKSIFELRGRYVELASCSSAHSVVPVRLGRALPARVPSSPGQNRHLRRPVPPPPQANASTNKTGNGAGGKRAGRRVRPGANTAVKMIQRVIRRHCSASAPTGGVGGGGDGKVQANDFSSGSPRSPETTTHGYRPADESRGRSQPRRRSSSPTRADDTGSGHAPSNVDRNPGPSANAFTCDPRTTHHGHNMRKAEVSIGDEHLEDCRADDTDGSLTSRGPADGSGGADGEGCRRGRLCGTSPCTCASTSLDHPGTGQGPEVVTILERYTHLETYDCPVSPFSAPPSWADVPPLVTLEPPGFSRTSKNPAHDPSAMESGGRDEQWGGRKERDREGTGAEGGSVASGAAKTPDGGLRSAAEPRSGEVDPPLSFPPRKEDRIAMATTRPAEKTVFQIISSGRRMSYGWGWTRPSGERGGRKRRTGKGRVGAGSSPSLVGRERRGRTNVHVSAFPPTS